MDNVFLSVSSHTKSHVELIMMRKTLPFVLIVGLLLVTLAPLSMPTFGEFDFLRYWASTLVLLGLLMRGYRV